VKLWESLKKDKNFYHKTFYWKLAFNYYLIKGSQASRINDGQRTFHSLSAQRIFSGHDIFGERNKLEWSGRLISGGDMFFPTWNVHSSTNIVLSHSSKCENFCVKPGFFLRDVSALKESFRFATRIGRPIFFQPPWKS